MVYIHVITVFVPQTMDRVRVLIDEEHITVPRRSPLEDSEQHRPVLLQVMP